MTISANSSEISTPLLRHAGGQFAEDQQRAGDEGQGQQSVAAVKGGAGHAGQIHILQHGEAIGEQQQQAHHGERQNVILLGARRRT